MTKVRALDKSVRNKKVLVRVDFNVPLEKKGSKYKVADSARIENVKETIDWLINNDNKVILISHVGRPTSAKEDQYSLKYIYEYLRQLNWWPSLKFVDETVGPKVEKAIDEMKSGDVLLLENIRYNDGEEKNSPEFVEELAKLGDVFVNEAFSTSHRAHASVYGIAKKLPAYGGFAFIEEMTSLETIVTNPKRPMVVIVGGAKISDKVAAIENLADKSDVVLVGGGVANNFIKAEGVEIFKSYLQDVPTDLAKRGVNFVKIAKDIIEKNKYERFLKDGYIPLTKIVYPFDVVAATSPDAKKSQVVDLHQDMPDSEDDKNLMYLDIGPMTTKLYQEIVMSAGTVFWNGPMGVFENEKFATGTAELARSVAKTAAYTIIGGGDTIAAVRSFGYQKRVDFISTAGGAGLQLLAGDKLPGIEVLKENGVDK